MDIYGRYLQFGFLEWQLIVCKNRLETNVHPCSPPENCKFMIAGHYRY